MKDNEMNDSRKNLTDKDFYTQACEYFYYHAGQRTTMIQYFIAVFGASIALYGSLLKDYPLASLLISAFLLLVSILFYAIDLRNRFDVKHSQSVICQIERDYNKHKLQETETDPEYVYGVFSNEDNIFEYYGREKRRESTDEAFKNFRQRYKDIKKLGGKKTDSCALEKLWSDIDSYFEENKITDISRKEYKEAVKSHSIVSLSASIRRLYFLCMGVSVLGFVLALFVSYGFYFVTAA